MKKIPASLSKFFLCSKNRLFRYKNILPAIALASVSNLSLAFPSETIVSLSIQNNAPQVDVRQFNPTDAISLSSVYNSPYYPSQGLGFASGSAKYGVLKVSASSQAGFVVDTTSGASADFYDTMTINSDGKAGSIGYMSVRMKSDWLSSVGANGGGAEGQGSTSISFAGSTVQYINTIAQSCDGTLNCYWQNSAEKVSSILGEQSTSSSLTPSIQNRIDEVVTLPFYFGEPSSLWMNIYAYASASGTYDQAPASSLVDGSHSTYWGGIVGITDDRGISVDFSVASESGTDYRSSFIPSAVPEPSAYAMLLAGLIYFLIVAACRFFDNASAVR